MADTVTITPPKQQARTLHRAIEYLTKRETMVVTRLSEDELKTYREIYLKLAEAIYGRYPQ